MPDPQDLDRKVRQQSAWLTKVTMSVLLVLFLATLGSLIYGFRILHEIQVIRAESPQNTAAVVAQLIEGIDCTNQENLEIAVNAILEQTRPDIPPLRIEFRDDCPDRPFPDAFSTENEAS